MLSILGRFSLYEAQRQKTYFLTCAPSEELDQPALSRSLIRIFTGCILDNKECILSSCGQRILWSDHAGRQADLSLHLVHMSEGTFSHVVACIFILIFPQNMVCRFMEIVRKTVYMKGQTL